MTTFEAFRNSVSDTGPPSDLGPALQALWWLRKGDWNRAHEVCQGHEGDRDCDWVHAHLHREEGDLSNAGYWYRHAGRPVATCPLQEEWEQVARTLISSPLPR